MKGLHLRPDGLAHDLENFCGILDCAGHDFADGRKVEAAGAKALGETDAEPLGRDIIHSVTNPIGRLTGAIHVYGGDFFGVPRKEWDPERLTEQPYDVEKTLKMFEEHNRLYADRA